MTDNTIEIAIKGMKCLIDNMGIVDAEQFISIIIREKLDYTKWQQIYYDSMKPGEFHEKALEYAKTHPYTGKAKRI